MWSRTAAINCSEIRYLRLYKRVHYVRQRASSK